MGSQAVEQFLAYFRSKTERVSWGKSGPLPGLGVAQQASLDEILKSSPDKTELLRYGDAIYVLHFSKEQEEHALAFGRPSASMTGFYRGNDEFPEEPLFAAFYMSGLTISSSPLARFFNVAKGKRLFPQEEWLLNLLLENGIICEGKGRYVPPKSEKSIVSFNGMDRASDSWRGIHAHELSHGLYLTNKAYRDYCENFWDKVMTSDDRDKFTYFLVSQGYSQRREIVIDEFQAYFVNSRFAKEHILHLFSEQRYEELRAAFIKDSPAPCFADLIDRAVSK